MEVEEERAKVKEARGASAILAASRDILRGIVRKEKEHCKEEVRRVKEKEKTAHGFADSMDIVMCVVSGAIQNDTANGELV